MQIREMGIENETSLSNQTGKQTCTVRLVSRRKRESCIVISNGCMKRRQRLLKEYELASKVNLMS